MGGRSVRSREGDRALGVLERGVEIAGSEVGRREVGPDPRLRRHVGQSDEVGTEEAWYRLLNVGVPIALSAETDVFSNFYRSMAVGTARVYVRIEGELNLPSHLDGLRAGRSFVTTGPFLDFRVKDAGPGDVIEAGDAAFSIELASALPVERVEVLVNGKVVFEDEGLTAPGKKSYSGRVSLPAGGWIAARVRGGATVWPSMDSYPFAHTGPIWIGSVGSLGPRQPAFPRESFSPGSTSPARSSRRVTKAPRFPSSRSDSRRPGESSKR